MAQQEPPYLILWLRSFAFWVMFPISMVIFAMVLMLAALASFQTRWQIVQAWVHLNLWWLKVTCRLTHEVQGLENIPPGAGIVMSKHQSTWETIALQLFFPPQVWVAKRELMWIPFFGWGLALMKCIHIKRGTGRLAMAQLVSQGKARLDEGLWVIIFPEGTRIPAGQRGRYRIGGGVLAQETGYPIVPVAHNAGEYWPRRSFIKRPGVIQVRIGKPIDSAGREAQALVDEAAEWIEARMAEITTLK